MEKIKIKTKWNKMQRGRFTEVVKSFSEEIKKGYPGGTVKNIFGVYIIQDLQNYCSDSITGLTIEYATIDKRIIALIRVDHSGVNYIHCPPKYECFKGFKYALDGNAIEQFSDYIEVNPGKVVKKQPFTEQEQPLKNKLEYRISYAIGVQILLFNNPTLFNQLNSNDFKEAKNIENKNLSYRQKVMFVLCERLQISQNDRDYLISKL